MTVQLFVCLFFLNNLFFSEQFQIYRKLGQRIWVYLTPRFPITSVMLIWYIFYIGEPVIDTLLLTKVPTLALLSFSLFLFQDVIQDTTLHLVVMFAQTPGCDRTCLHFDDVILVCRIENILKGTK